MTRVTVLGGGNTAFSLAARLALDGHDVLMWEHPDFADSLEPIGATLQIALVERGERRIATLCHATTDAAFAMSWSDMLLCSVPSYAHQPFVDALAPHLRPGHVVVLLPGNLGSLAFAKALHQRNVQGVVVAESDTAPYVCRKTAPGEATIWGTIPALGVGVFPASQTSEVLPEIAGFLPASTRYESVVEAGLSAMNSVIHPAGVLMNAGRIERSRGEFWFYEEGVTPAVVRVVEAVDTERRAIGKALGIELTPVAEAFHGAGFGPNGDLWSVINGSQMLTALRAPGMLDSRWLTEDVPYGLATWAALGMQNGVETPTMTALIHLAAATLGRAGWSDRRSLSDLGISDLTPDQLNRYVSHGTFDKSS